MATDKKFDVEPNDEGPPKSSSSQTTLQSPESVIVTRNKRRDEALLKTEKRALLTQRMLGSTSRSAIQSTASTSQAVSAPFQSNFLSQNYVEMSAAMKEAMQHLEEVLSASEF